eukprot:8492206-Alexandrium_andersonii.AAC.1
MLSTRARTRGQAPPGPAPRDPTSSRRGPGERDRTPGAAGQPLCSGHTCHRGLPLASRTTGLPA